MLRCPHCRALLVLDPDDRTSLACPQGCDEERCVACGRYPSEGVGCSSCPGYNGQGYCTGRSDCDCPQHQADDEEALNLYSYEVTHGLAG